MPRYFGKDFNIFPGQNASTNTTNLLNAIAAMQSDGITLMAEEGGNTPYDFDGNFVLNFSRASILASGPRVSFRHRGTGRFFDFSGHPIGNNGITQCEFGGAFQIMVMGNPAGGTTDCLHVSRFVDGKVRMRGRDADVCFRLDAGGVADKVGAVLSRFDITIASGWDGAPYNVRPRHGLAVYGAYNCRWRINPEGCGVAGGYGYGAYFDECGRNYITGTTESNLSGGLYFTSTCRNMTVDSMDNEWNGTAPDMSVHGSENTFRKVIAGAGGDGKNAPISGSRNSFEGCELPGAIVTGAKNRFFECNLTGWTDNGSGTIVRNCIGSADKN